MSSNRSKDRHSNVADVREVSNHFHTRPAGAVSHSHGPWSLTINDHINLRVGPGFEILEVNTGFETPWIVIEKLPTHISVQSVSELLSRFGEVADLKVEQEKKFASAMARFTSYPAARKACLSLHQSMHFNRVLLVKQPVKNKAGKGGVLNDCIVHLSWDLPGKIGYGGYASQEDALLAIELAQDSRDHFVFARIHDDLPAVSNFTVQFRGLPHDASRRTLDCFMPIDVMFEASKYSSAEEAANSMKRLLRTRYQLSAFALRGPPYEDGKVHACAEFRSSADAEKAAIFIDGRRLACLGSGMVHATRTFSFTYSISVQEYSKIEHSLYHLRKALQRGQIPRASLNTKLDSTTDRPGPRRHLVKLSACSMTDLGLLKAEFEKILYGEAVRLNQSASSDHSAFFQSTEGEQWLCRLRQDYAECGIESDSFRRILTVFGHSELRKKVKELIVGKITELDAEASRAITLDPFLIGLFIKFELTPLKERLGSKTIYLDLWRRQLKIRGSSSDLKIAQDAVDNLRTKYSPAYPSTTVSSCPICFDDASSPVRLNGCGHAYCHGCLVNYLQSSIENRLLPLTCLGSGGKCEKRIPLAVAKQVLPRGEFDAILKAALSHHVDRHPDEFHYCPTPDCTQIYRPANRGAVLQCPSCLVKICPSCHVAYHEGFECPDPEKADRLFLEWAEQSDTKKCPGCQIFIERIAGCNHVTCTRCQTHMCWVCLKAFPKGEGIYAHMQTEHGDWGLGP